MAIYKAEKVFIDIEKQDYQDADCKYMVSFWHQPKDLESRELISVCLTNQMPLVQSLNNKGNVVESITKQHELEIPNG
jgi:hypothetical protein